jgi:hypothetical protein
MDQEGNAMGSYPVKSERSRRLHALGVALTALILLSIAFILNPAEEGIGTHQQLGLPQCGWILAADIPCPTCGMTTAWSHTVRGEFPTAFMTQPMGMFLAFITFLVAVGGCITAVTGYSFQPLLYRFPPSRIIILASALALLAWGFKILMHKGMV